MSYTVSILEYYIEKKKSKQQQHIESPVYSLQQ